MSFSTFDYQCMASALQLARLGLKTSHPNPRVGCVISLDGKVVGSGWHKKTGEAHAEINALRETGDKSEGATLHLKLSPAQNQRWRNPLLLRQTGHL